MKKEGTKDLHVLALPRKLVGCEYQSVEPLVNLDKASNLNGKRYHVEVSLNQKNSKMIRPICVDTT